MPAADDLLKAIPLDRLAARLGVDPATAEAAARQAIPALIGGMQANAQDPAGAASLERAVSRHDPGLTEGGVDLDQVDEGDGDKIVGHVFGDRRGAVVDRIADGGVDGGLVAKLLPMLAPIVMSYLAGKVARKDVGERESGLGELLGSVLGGGGGKGTDIADVLGGLLGGGRR